MWLGDDFAHAKLVIRITYFACDTERHME